MGASFGGAKGLGDPSAKGCVAVVGSEKWQLLSRVRLSATPWTVAHQASPFVRFSRQEYWSGLLVPSPGELPDPGIELGSPALQADALQWWKQLPKWAGSVGILSPGGIRELTHLIRLT